MKRTAAAPRSDRDLGIRTARRVAPGALACEGPSAVHAHAYEPTPYGVLDEMLIGLDIAYRDTTFVDLGSGRGRILCLAAERPFRRIIGVELSRALHEAAVENLAALALPPGRVRALHADAATFAFPPGPLVVFLFNPFAAPVLARVLENLERAVRAHQATAHILYYMPVHDTILRRAAFLEPCDAARDWSIHRTALA